MDGERIAIFDCLYRRVGELTAHIGRYDMQLVAFAWKLTDEVVLQELIEKWSIEVRIDVIGRLMQARQCSAALQHQFLDIHLQMKPVLDRQTLSAEHPAVITQIGFVRPWEKLAVAAPKNDWFTRTATISQDEVHQSIASVERDILTAVKLYLSLSTLAARVHSALQPNAAAAV